MTERKNIIILIGFVMSVSLLSASLTGVLMSKYYNRAHTRVLGRICQNIVDNLNSTPEAERAVLTALKEYANHSVDFTDTADENILLSYGYQRIDFLKSARAYGRIFILSGFLAGGILFLGTFLFRHRKETLRIRTLTDYLDRVNNGGGGVLLQSGEDEFSRLQDEICKTVTELHQTRDEAVKARNNFAENLYNIAHQIKTPVTSVSLTAQMICEEMSVKRVEDSAISGHLARITKQTARLTRLEEALLLLSRIDAGTLTLERKEIDVFTLLTLSADSLQELFQRADVTVDIPEAAETLICADMDWIMEAVMNLLKNCMEHTPPGGTVHCSYEQNPLYTQIRIWDNGAGFAAEDIPHLFERFYRGKNEKNGGIGIGLALSKAVIERQNGTITARNLPEGGACFEIHFYCH